MNFPQFKINQTLHNSNPATKRADGTQLPTNYFPSHQFGPKKMAAKPTAEYNHLSVQEQQHDQWVRDAVSFNISSATVDTEEEEKDFVQPREAWAILGKEPGHQQENFIRNVATNLSGAVPTVRAATYGKSYFLISPSPLTPFPPLLSLSGWMNWVN